MNYLAFFYNLSAIAKGSHLEIRPILERLFCFQQQAFYSGKMDILCNEAQ